MMDEKYTIINIDVLHKLEPMMDEKYTIDPNLHISYFAKNIIVKCPNCQEKAIANRDQVICSHCKFQHFVGEWVNKVNGSINGSCTNCGWKYNELILGNSDDTLDVFIFSCEKCKTENQAIIKWHTGYLDSPLDPFFALPLWLQTMVGKNVLWCYNQEHLNYIKQYVSTELRPTSYPNNSLISRLPKFIKLAKNRKKILRALNQLEAKV